MADLPENDDWTPGIYQLETSDPVLGGPEGIDNLQAKQLASRTRWLRNFVEKLVIGVASVGKAKQLDTARKLSFKGAATASGMFDGTADVDFSLVLTDSGIAPGAYTKVTFNAKGLATAASSPTTLAGYGITDALSKGYAGLGGKTAAIGTIDSVGLEGGFYSFGAGQSTFGNYVSVLSFPYTTDDYAGQLGFKYAGAEPVILVRSTKTSGVWGNTRTLWHSGNFEPSNYALKATTLAGYGITDAASAVDVSKKADKATTLAGYGITDGALTSDLAAKANKATTLSGYGITDAYTQPQITNLLDAKASKATTLIGYGIADAYTKPYIDGELSKKATWAITLGGYGITDAFTKTEVIAALANKLSVGGVSQQVPVLAAGTTGSTYAASALQIREGREVGAMQDSDEYAPAIGLHWLGRATGRLIMDALGVLKWNGQSILLGFRATQSEVDSGGGDNNVVTVATMRFGFNYIKGGGGANNAIVFPRWLGGMMVQWGVHIANSADTETAVTFPLGFNIIPACVSTLTHDGSVTQSTVVSQSRQLTASGFLSRREDIGTASSFSGTAYIRWIAVGY